MGTETGPSGLEPERLPERRRQTDGWVIGCTFISLLCTIIVIVGGYTVLKNRATIVDVQTERYTNTLAVCNDINERHDKTIARLDKLYVRATKAAKGDAARLKQLSASKQSTILLINAIIPKRNCQAIAQKAVPSAADSPAVTSAD